jgi:predicted RNA polymerase sigma factor
MSILSHPVRLQWHGTGTSHPALSREARVALTLKTVCGLRLNRAVALAQWRGAGAGLAAVEADRLRRPFRPSAERSHADVRRRNGG